MGILSVSAYLSTGMLYYTCLIAGHHVLVQVDDSLSELNRHLPSLLKQASSQALMAAQKAPEVARDVALEVQRDGIVDASKHVTKTLFNKYEPTAREIYDKYEPVAEQFAVSAWHSLNRLPLFTQVAQIIVPTAAYWSEKYNQVVCFAADRGYTVASFLPLIPLERIAKVFKEAENGPTISSNGEGAVMTQ